MFAYADTFKIQVRCSGTRDTLKRSFTRAFHNCLESYLSLVMRLMPVLHESEHTKPMTFLIINILMVVSCEAEEGEGAVAPHALGERRDASVADGVVVHEQRHERRAAARRRRARRACGGAEGDDGAEAAGEGKAALGGDLEGRN